MDRDQVLFRLFGKFCPEGTILFTEGSPGEEVYLIQSGKVRVGGDGPAATLGPGEVLGEEALLAKTLRTARAEVVEDSRMLQVSDRTLAALVRHGPEVGRLLLGELLSLACASRTATAGWTAAHLLRRVGPELVEAARAPFYAADLAQRAGLVPADARLVLEELLRRRCLVREGDRYRAPDQAQLRREVEALAAAGERP